MAKVQFDPELMRNIKIIYGDADLDERTLRQLHQTWATNPDIIRRTAQQKMPKLQEAYFDAPEMPSLPTRLEPLPTAEIAQDDLRGVKDFKTAFRAARERGLKQFMWGNSVYTTDLGQPSSKPKQPSTSDSLVRYLDQYRSSRPNCYNKRNYLGQRNTNYYRRQLASQ